MSIAGSALRKGGRWRPWFAAISALSPLLLIAAAPTQEPQGKYDPRLWEEDFAQIKEAMSSHYANLEWATEIRGMDLPRLSQETTRRLAVATSEAEARRALESFLNAFGDGHVGVQWPSRPLATGAQKPVMAATGIYRACREAGYGERNLPAGLNLQKMARFSPLVTAESRYFPIGTVQLKGFGTVGVLRIALFDVRPFP